MGLKAQMPQVLHYKWTLVERGRDRGVGAKREEGDAKLPKKSSPDSQEKKASESRHDKKRESPETQGTF